ncbi:MAG: twin-arginine translocase subunit TatC [Actinomycetota bacterium]|nr:twin-arginine translocase subunit TatC [Actinomycetota bacterium]MDP9019622.1 twin-arginine translocase subunit TatC [Actinomycetota bacterium]
MALRSRRTEEPLGSSPQPPGDESMTLVEHLTELRSRLVKALVALALGGFVGFLLYEPVLEILQAPYCQISEECDFVVTDPLESFSIRLKVSAYVGLLIASPVVLWQLWRFITPGLYPNEKRYAVPFVLSSVVLFVLGAGLALWTFPNALEFLVQIGGESLQPLYTPNKYLSLVIFMMLAFGVGFEFPIVLIFLQMAGVLTWQRLASWRRWAIVGIFVLVAVITPSGDPFTLLALAMPMYVFYECSIVAGRLLLKGRT